MIGAVEGSYIVEHLVIVFERAKPCKKPGGTHTAPLQSHPAWSRHVACKSGNLCEHPPPRLGWIRTQLAPISLSSSRNDRLQEHRNHKYSSVVIVDNSTKPAMGPTSPLLRRKLLRSSSGVRVAVPSFATTTLLA
jgi:hypothetical protein